MAFRGAATSPEVDASRSASEYMEEDDILPIHFFSNSRIFFQAKHAVYKNNR